LLLLAIVKGTSKLASLVTPLFTRQGRIYLLVHMQDTRLGPKAGSNIVETLAPRMVKRVGSKGSMAKGEVVSVVTGQLVRVVDDAIVPTKGYFDNVLPAHISGINSSRHFEQCLLWFKSR
jgi:hypothetical protein